ncbi:MAG: hypothetical protein K1Y01_11960 [Vicinamibacteria bacterium]|nr:hypothetical protein [Vicinamibacteria bacterium]
MKNPTLTARTLILVSGFGLGLAFPATGAERTIALKAAPVAVQKAIADRLKGGRLKSLSVETEGGEAEYEAEVMVDGHDRTLVIDASGRVLETETVMELGALPEAVRVGLAREAGKASITKVEEVVNAGVTSYEATLKETGKKDREVVVDGDGKLVRSAK